MSSQNTDLSWLDEHNPEVKPGLQCDIEMSIEEGETLKETASAVAKTLRALAGQIESGVLDTGHHPISSPTGQKIGEIYLDWFGSM